MKQLYPAAVLLLVTGTAGHAVELNTEALKKMQQEGHRIVAESMGPRAYRIADDLCLAGGDVLSVEKCDSKAKNQQWESDDKGRLVSHDGQCIAGNKLKKCAGGKVQIWTHDDKGRLVNEAQQCLQVQGKSPKPGAKVVTAKCSGSRSQVWS